MFCFCNTSFFFPKDLLKLKWVCFANQLKSLSKWNDTEQLPFIRIQIKNCIFKNKNAKKIQSYNIQNQHKQNSFIWFPFIHFNYFKLIFDRMKFRFQFALLLLFGFIEKRMNKKNFIHFFLFQLKKSKNHFCKKQNQNQHLFEIDNIIIHNFDSLHSSWFAFTKI